MEITGFIFSTVDQTIHLAGVIRRHVESHNRLHDLAAAIEAKAIRSSSITGQLRSLLGVPGISQELFEEMQTDLNEVNAKLLAIGSRLRKSNTASLFLRAPVLIRELEEIDGKLGCMDESSRTIGIIGSMISSYQNHNRLATETEEQTRKLILKALSALLSTSDRKEEVIDLLVELEAKLHESSMIHPDLLHVTDPDFALAMGLKAYNVQPGMGGTIASFRAPQDIPSAARYFRRACSLGKKEAYRYLGDIYYEGKGMQGSFRTAVEIYQKGRECNDAASTFKLGWCYTLGHGVEVNRSMAIQLQEEAVRGGCGEAIFELGTLKLHGKMVDTNHSQAVNLLQRANQMGVFRAKGQLALCYNQGIVFDRNLQKAFELLREAFDGGDLMATADLANSYDEKQNFEEAAKVYENCMNAGTWQSDFYKAYYGLRLVQGLGVEKDVALGKAIVSDSTKSGSGISWHALGECYRYGYGFKKDLRKAKQFYQRAADCVSGVQGIVAANVALGEMFEMGEGVLANTRRAYGFYLVAAKRMCQIAQWRVANAFESGVGRTRDMHQAVYYFKLCADSGHRGAQEKTVHYYFQGHGLERSRVKTRRMMSEAAENGNADAARWLRREGLLSIFRRSKSSPI